MIWAKVEAVQYICVDCAMHPPRFTADSLDELVAHVKEHRFRCPGELSFRVEGGVGIDTTVALENDLITPDEVLAPYLAEMKRELKKAEGETVTTEQLQAGREGRAIAEVIADDILSVDRVRDELFPGIPGLGILPGYGPWRISRIRVRPEACQRLLNHTYLRIEGRVYRSHHYDMEGIGPEIVSATFDVEPVREF